MKRILGQVSWYTGSTLANSAIGLLVVPVIIAVAGADEWGSIAVGQAIGNIATIFVALGWGYNGPSLIARASGTERRVIAIHSVVARSVMAPAVALVAGLVAASLAPTLPGAAVIACVGVTLGGLGMPWYFVGAGQPKRLFMLDGLPRWIGNVAGVAAILVWRDVYAFLWCQFAGGILSSVLSSRAVIVDGPSVPAGTWKVRSAFQGVRNQLFAGITVITATTFASLPTLVIAALSPTAVPIYALGERLVRFAIMAVTPLHQWMQGWVPRTSDSKPRAWRMRWAVKVSIWLSIPIGATVAVLGPWAGWVLSAGVVELPLALTLPLGVAVAMSTISRVVGMACLLALGEERVVAVSAVLGAAVGTPLLFALVATAGAPGAAVALATFEVLVVWVQLVALKRLLQSE